MPYIITLTNDQLKAYRDIASKFLLFPLMPINGSGDRYRFTNTEYNQVMGNLKAARRDAKGRTLVSIDLALQGLLSFEFTPDVVPLTLAPAQVHAMVSVLQQPITPETQLVIAKLNYYATYNDGCTLLLSPDEALSLELELHAKAVRSPFQFESASAKNLWSVLAQAARDAGLELPATRDKPAEPASEPTEPTIKLHLTTYEANVLKNILTLYGWFEPLEPLRDMLSSMLNYAPNRRSARLTLNLDHAQYLEAMLKEYGQARAGSDYDLTLAENLRKTLVNAIAHHGRLLLSWANISRVLDPHVTYELVIYGPLILAAVHVLGTNLRSPSIQKAHDTLLHASNTGKPVTLRVTAKELQHLERHFTLFIRNLNGGTDARASATKIWRAASILMNANKIPRLHIEDGEKLAEKPSPPSNPILELTSSQMAAVIRLASKYNLKLENELDPSAISSLERVFAINFIDSQLHNGPDRYKHYRSDLLAVRSLLDGTSAQRLASANPRPATVSADAPIARKEATPPSHLRALELADLIIPFTDALAQYADSLPDNDTWHRIFIEHLHIDLVLLNGSLTNKTKGT